MVYTIKTSREIHDFYTREILPSLKSLEESRLKVKVSVKRYLQLLLVSWIAIFFLLLLITRAWWDSLTASTGFNLFVFGVIACYSDRIDMFRSKARWLIEGRLIKFLAPQFRYEPNGKIPLGTFLRAQFFLHTTHEYNGRNMASGRIGETRITFSEVESIQKLGEDKHSLFGGIFLVADFNKDFKTRTIVVPDLAQSMLGSMGQTLQSMNVCRPPLIKLEDPEFENYFAVYADDQIEARYILSPALMNRILNYRKKHDRCIYLSCIGHRLFMAIQASYPLFQPKLSVSLFEFRQIEDYCDILQMALSAVDELNLNIRIWTKK
ncbi:MAG: DUF3137 domain-containing protein [Planctomycetaceae bacterium]|nr:DUF3137 domain-containing protein [Planctomycetaceae bacterium]